MRSPFAETNTSAAYVAAPPNSNEKAKAAARPTIEPSIRPQQSSVSGPSPAQQPIPDNSFPSCWSETATGSSKPNIAQFPARSTPVGGPLPAEPPGPPLTPP